MKTATAYKELYKVLEDRTANINRDAIQLALDALEILELMGYEDDYRVETYLSELLDDQKLTA